MPTQTPSPAPRTPDPATATPDTAPTPRLSPETCSATQEDQTAVLAGPFLPSMADLSGIEERIMLHVLSNLKALELTAMAHAYLATALWSSTDDEGNPLDATHEPDDVSPSFKVHADDACIDFLRDAVAAGVTLNDLRDIGFEQSGRDLWLTRNRHGAGFWDRGLGKLGGTLTEVAHAMGSRDVYVGDDGLVYVQQPQRPEHRTTPHARP